MRVLLALLVLFACGEEHSHLWFPEVPATSLDRFHYMVPSLISKATAVGSCLNLLINSEVSGPGLSLFRGDYFSYK